MLVPYYILNMHFNYLITRKTKQNSWVNNCSTFQWAEKQARGARYDDKKASNVCYVNGLGQ